MASGFLLRGERSRDLAERNLSGSRREGRRSAARDVGSLTSLLVEGSNGFRVDERSRGEIDLEANEKVSASASTIRESLVGDHLDRARFDDICASFAMDLTNNE